MTDINHNVFLPLKDVKNLVRRLKIHSSTEWFTWARSANRPNNIPIVPYYIYRNQWKNWYDFLGNEKKEILPYDEAKKIIIHNKIKSLLEWKNFIKKYKNLPCDPAQVYKNKGWINWTVFLNKNRRYEKYHVNHNFFQKSSSNMIYILGFWWADGCIIKSNNIFDISQHKKDEKFLLGIREIMDSNYPLTKENNIVRFRVSSPQIVKDIYKLGGLSNKSLKIKMPLISNKYMSDFIRGYFDGDGCITYDKHSDRYRADFTSGSKQFIYQLKKKLSECANISDCHIRKIQIPAGYSICNRIINKKSIYYRLCLNKENTVKLGKFMYKASPILKLTRKYNLFMKALADHAKEQKTK